MLTQDEDGISGIFSTRLLNMPEDPGKPPRAGRLHKMALGKSQAQFTKTCSVGLRQALNTLLFQHSVLSSPQSCQVVHKNAWTSRASDTLFRLPLAPAPTCTYSYTDTHIL